MNTPRILIIDDDVRFTQLVKMTLERKAGYEVFVDNDGTEPRKTVAEFLPDLILLDIQMPKANGARIAQDLQDAPELSEIPIIYVTGIVPKEVSLPHKSLGGYPFLAKPVDSAELLNCIRENLKTKPGEMQ